MGCIQRGQSPLLLTGTRREKKRKAEEGNACLQRWKQDSPPARQLVLGLLSLGSFDENSTTDDNKAHYCSRKESKVKVKGAHFWFPSRLAYRIDRERARRCAQLKRISFLFFPGGLFPTPRYAVVPQKSPFVFFLSSALSSFPPLSFSLSLVHSLSFLVSPLSNRQTKKNTKREEKADSK